MTEEDARGWLTATLGVSRETILRFDDYATRLIAENRCQNLISSNSEPMIWVRHLIDAAQLYPLVRGHILDVGSGAGLPGIPLAILGAHVTLSEPRRKRAEFLDGIVSALALPCETIAKRVEQISSAPFDTITARAYAQLTTIFAATRHLSHPGTRWVLPKGRTGLAELETARDAWHGDFQAIPSISDPEAVIIVAEAVKPKAHR